MVFIALFHLLACLLVCSSIRLFANIVVFILLVMSYFCFCSSRRHLTGTLLFYCNNCIYPRHSYVSQPPPHATVKMAVEIFFRHGRSVLLRLANPHTLNDLIDRLIDQCPHLQYHHHHRHLQHVYAGAGDGARDGARRAAGGGDVLPHEITVVGAAPRRAESTATEW